MKTTATKFPGDTLVLGESRYRLKSLTRKEWLNDAGEVTTWPAEATDFGSAMEASWWLINHIDQPQLYHFEEFFTIES